MKIRQLAELKGYIFECFSLVLQNIFVTVESAEGLELTRFRGVESTEVV